MGHRRAREPKERGEVGRAQFGPVGQGFEAAVARELGDHGEGKQGRERVAPPAPLAPIRNRLQMDS